MRLAFVIGVVTLCVTINSHAVPARTNGIKTAVSNNETKQSQQFVIELARNFSSLYFQKLTQYVGDSRIVSPLSVFIPMSMLTYGARGETRKKFFKAIGLPQDKSQIAKIGYRNFLDQLAKYDVRIKTKIFISPDVELNSYFVDLSKKIFHSEIQVVDVNNGFMDSKKINEWVAAQTNDNVTELFKPQNIGPDPSIVLVNTVYFKGTWKHAFDSSRTSLQPFHPFGGHSLDVPTMCTVGSFRYGRLDDLGIHFIELPYEINSKNNAMSMFILLPTVMEDTVWLRKLPELRNIKLERLLKSERRKVEVFLPKFKIETTVSLNKWLDWIFAPAFPFKDAANFSGIFKSSKLLNLGESLTKVVIEVDEKGQETAESSGISHNSTETVATSRNTRSTVKEVMQFKVDQPFIAMIVTKGKILTDIFSINFSGSQFIPADVNYWW